MQHARDRGKLAVQTRREPRQAVCAPSASTQSTSLSIAMTMTRAQITAGITAKPGRAHASACSTTVATAGAAADFIQHLRQMPVLRRDVAAGLSADRLTRGESDGLTTGLYPGGRVPGRSSNKPITAIVDAGR